MCCYEATRLALVDSRRSLSLCLAIGPPIFLLSLLYPLLLRARFLHSALSRSPPPAGVSLISRLSIYFCVLLGAGFVLRCLRLTRMERAILAGVIMKRSEREALKSRGLFKERISRVRNLNDKNFKWIFSLKMYKITNFPSRDNRKDWTLSRRLNPHIWYN